MYQFEVFDIYFEFSFNPEILLKLSILSMKVSKDFFDPSKTADASFANRSSFNSRSAD